MAVARLSAVERRQAIIEAAIRLFSEKGFRGVTTRELANAVGVSEPILYQHFQTKREIYSAIVESKSCEVEKKFGPSLLLSSDYEQDDRTILRNIGASITRWYQDDPALNRLLMFSSLEGHEFSDLFFARHASTQFDSLRQYFEHRIEQSTFRKFDPSIAAWAFIGMIAHHSMTRILYHFDPYPRPQEQIINEMVDLFLRGIQGSGAKNARKK
jgi:AcrR family transcriptional regulator